MYSQEDGTPAEKLENQVPDSIKRKRYDKLMKLARSHFKRKISSGMWATHIKY